MQRLGCKRNPARESEILIIPDAAPLHLISRNLMATALLTIHERARSIPKLSTRSIGCFRFVELRMLTTWDELGVDLYLLSISVLLEKLGKINSSFQWIEICTFESNLFLTIGVFSSKVFKNDFSLLENFCFHDVFIYDDLRGRFN